MCQQNAHEVATLLGEDGATVPLNRPGRVVVYRRNKGVWQPDRELLFEIDPEKGLGEMRSRTRDLLRFLNECRTFVTRSASGALFYELEKGQFNVWEVLGRPEEFLEQLWSEEELERDEEPMPIAAVIPVPLERTPGDFAISIRDIQGKRPELSSKRVLQQFIRSGKFRSLEITCDHVPPWIEMEAAGVGFTMETEPLGKGEILVRLVMTGRGPSAGRMGGGSGCGC